MGVNKEEISKTIIELEKSHNERWSAGDNRGCLDGFAEEVSYFDPILKNVLVGRDKVIAGSTPSTPTRTSCAASTSTRRCTSATAVTSLSWATT
ncbi:hypothetical protein ACFYQ5_13370 [Streptomyces sp. NPDC005794]|uniref:hypothetical protein n=1 Tax=Streptomyces sp. NPDC005794 TaxID=3364733 RepID=UPI0036A3133B